MADRYSWTNASDYSVGNADGVKGKLTQWNRSTVADGKWLNQETIVPMSGRDEYLLDSLNDLGGDFDSYTATTDTTLETMQDAIDTNADNIDTLNQVVANKQDKLGKNNQGYGINIYEAGDPDDPAAPTTTTIAAAPGNTSYIGYVDDGDGTLKYALSAEIGVKSIDAIGPDGFNIITGFDSIDSTEVAAETMQSTYIASTDEEVEKMETSEVLTLLSDTLTLEGSTSIDVNTDPSTAKTTVSLITTNVSGLVIESDGVAVNPDNITIQLSSGQVAAKLAEDGGINGTSDNGMSVNVDDATIQLSSGQVAAKLAEDGGINGTSSDGMSVNVDDATIQLSSGQVAAKLAENGGINGTSDNGMSVNVDDATIQLSSGQVAAKLAENGGINGTSDNGMSVNVDDATIQLSSGQVAAKLAENGGINGTSDKGMSVKVNASSMELDENGVGVKINSEGGLNAGKDGVQVKLHTNEDSGDADSGLKTDEQGLKVNVDGKTITINDDNQLVGSDGLPEYNKSDVGCVLQVNENTFGSPFVGWVDPNDTIDIDNETIKSKINDVDGLGVHNSSRFVYHTSDAAFTRSPVYTSLFHCNQTNLSVYDEQDMFKPNLLFANTSVENSSLFTKTWPVNITDMTWDNAKKVYMWSQGSYLTLVDLSFNININSIDVAKIKKTNRCKKKYEVYLGRFTYSPTSEKTLYLYPPADQSNDARYLIDCSIVYPTAGYCCCIKGSEAVPCSCNLNGGYYGLASHDEDSNGDTECWGDLYCCMNINDLPEEDVTFIGNLTFNVLTTPELVPQADPNNPVIHYRYMK